MIDLFRRRELRIASLANHPKLGITREAVAAASAIPPQHPRDDGYQSGPGVWYGSSGPSKAQPARRSHVVGDDTGRG